MLDVNREYRLLLSGLTTHITMVKTIRFLVTHISPMFDNILRFLTIAGDVVKAPLRSVKGNNIKNIHLPLTILCPVLLMSLLTSQFV